MNSILKMLTQYLKIFTTVLKQLTLCISFVFLRALRTFCVFSPEFNLGIPSIIEFTLYHIY